MYKVIDRISRSLIASIMYVIAKGLETHLAAVSVSRVTDQNISV